MEDVLVPLSKSLIVLDMGIDTSSPAGRACLTMLAAMAQMERELINERTKRGRMVKHEEGGYAYGAPRLGAKAVDGELVPDEVELETIALIKRHKRSGKSLAAIANYLNAQNIPTKRGGSWYASTIKNVLTAS